MTTPHPPAILRTPLGPEIVDEVSALITLLDLRAIQRPEWDRLKAILAVAALEAGDVEAGQRGYESTLIRWRASRWYDGDE